MSILERFEDLWLRRPYAVAIAAALLTAALAVVVGVVQLQTSRRARLLVEAVEPGGRPRPLTNGARVGLDEALTFRYDNPSGHRTLVVVGLGGGRLHLYAPRDPTEPAPAIGRSGALTAVGLAPDHAAGPLTIAGVFDQPLDAVARALRSGALANSRLATVLELELVEPQ